MVDAVAGSASAPPPTEAGGKLEVQGGKFKLDVEGDAGATSGPVEAAPESDRGKVVDVEA